MTITVGASPDVGTTVSSAEIENDSIVNADINTAAAIAPSKLGFTKTTYTQTYSTAAATVPDATAASVVTTAAGLAAYGYTEAQANAIPVAINATQADVLALKKVVTQLIDDLQANNIAA